MEKLIDKLDSYHLFNYLVPGFLFIILSKNIMNINIYNNGIVEMAFIAYFIGIIISRIGSLFVSKILDKRNADYGDYLKASKTDSKIESLLQERNMYRTLCSMLIVLILFKVLYDLIILFNIDKKIVMYLLYIALIFLFIKSYDKQNKYLVNRIKANCNKK